MGKFPRTVRGRREEVSGPAKCLFDSSPKFFHVLHRAHLRGWAWCVPESAGVPSLAAGKLGDSAGVSPSPRAGVPDVPDGPRRRAPHSVPTPRFSARLCPPGERGPGSPPPPATRSRPSAVGKAGRLREGPGLQTEESVCGIPRWKACRLHRPATPHCRGFSAWIAALRARAEQTPGSLVYAGSSANP